MSSTSLPERLMKYLERDPSTGCLVWKGVRTKKGYARVRWQGRRVRVTRLVWKLLRGRWPRKDREILHSCDNPPCCEPAHLREGTVRQNARDRHAKGRTKGCAVKGWKQQKEGRAA